MHRALIIGSAGQDGSYLTQLLRSDGYWVAGIDHRGRSSQADKVYHADARDHVSVRRIVAEVEPREVYFLCAFHHASEQMISSDHDLISRSFEVNTIALNDILKTISDVCPSARLAYASSSRVYGGATTAPQNEETPLSPVEPYGISKAAGMQICHYWRRSFGLFAVSAILYNHESPLRPPQFLSQKIVTAAIQAVQGRLKVLRLGDLDARVDWGHAADAVRAMSLMLRQSEPMDCIVATGNPHTVKDWLAEAFGIFGIDWRPFVTEDANLLNHDRPAAILCGDSSRIRQATGWRPKFDFKMLVRDMVQHALARQQLVSVPKSTRSL